MKAVMIVALIGLGAAHSQVLSDLSGTVLDPSRAPIPGVRVKARIGRRVQEVKTDSDGRFRLRALPSGEHEIIASFEGFQPKTIYVRLGAQAQAPIEILLDLAERQDEVTVEATSNKVSTDGADNLNALQADRTMLDNLPTLGQDYLGTLSRFLDPAATATGGVTLIVDGVEATKAGVSPSAIQEIKINQNPYTAEFSRPGRGRIEIITKSGADAFHGTVNAIFRDYHLNSRDAFASLRPPERRRIFEGSLLGPIGSGKATSFLVTANREEDDLQSVLFGVGPTGVIRGLTPAPVRNTEFSLKLNHEFSLRNAAFWQYTYQDRLSRNQGAGGFILPAAGFDAGFREDQFIFNHRGLITPRLLSQFRFLFGRYTAPTRSLVDAPKIIVLDAFTGGGAQANALRTEVHFAYNWIVTYSTTKHTLKTGMNVPDWSRRGSSDNTNRLGTYYFSSLADYAAGRAFSLIRQQGNGRVIFIEKVLGGFVQDDWQVRPNLTVSAGLRYDWQNYFHDNNNFSPRTAIAYAPGKGRKTVLRAGAGIFYDRTGPQPIFDLLRYNGTGLQRFVVSQPSYPQPDVLTAQPGSLVRLDQAVRIPYTLQFSSGVERQISKSTTLSVNYIGTRGISLFRSRDANAPFPPDFAVRPNPQWNVIRVLESAGRLNANSLEITLRGRLSKYFNGLVQYTLGRNQNNTSGINYLPARSYDYAGEWGRADFDRRHTLNLAGTLMIHRWINLGLNFQTLSQAPFNITTGRDDNRDGLANDRPVGVTRNTGKGAPNVTTDVRWFHDFRLGGRTKEAARIMTVGVDAFNVMNHVNYSVFSGALSSSFFGQPVAALNSRRLQLGLRFRF